MRISSGEERLRSDEAQGERLKAFVAVSDKEREVPALAAELSAYCGERLIRWSCPRDVEFLTELPKTRVGKIDFTEPARRQVTPS